METEDSNNLKIVANYINEVVKVDMIICFGVCRRTIVNTSRLQTPHTCPAQLRYDLLVVSETNVPDIVKLQHDCFSQTRIKVNLLVHSAEEVARLLADGNRLFLSIFKKADRLYLASSFQEMFDRISVFNQPDASLIWKDHYTKALSLHHVAEKILDNHKNAKDLMVKSLEIACIGFLKSKLGYQPRHTCLDYVFPLCSLVNNQFCSIFSIDTSALLFQEEKNHQEVFVGGLRVISILHQQCGAFLKAMESLFSKPDCP